MAFQSFEDLEVWKRACQFAVRTYEILRDCNDFAIRDQMQRAAVSIASNIAEGSERGGKDFSRFLRMAQGSAPELRTQMVIARKIGILTEVEFPKLITQLKEISKMIHGLRKSLNTENRSPKTDHQKPITEN